MIIELYNKENVEYEVLISRLSERVGDHLRKRGLVLVTAESCTGGWLSKVITEVPGSSVWFDCGFVTYSNASKTAMLGVESHLIEQYGAVSVQVVEAMVAGALARSRGTVAVSVSGIAGPDGGSDEKPVGLVCFGWGKKEQVIHSQIQQFVGSRDQIRGQSVVFLLQKILEL